MWVCLYICVCVCTCVCSGEVCVHACIYMYAAVSSNISPSDHVEKSCHEVYGVKMTVLCVDWLKSYAVEVKSKDFIERGKK